MPRLVRSGGEALSCYTRVPPTTRTESSGRKKILHRIARVAPLSP